MTGESSSKPVPGNLEGHTQEGKPVKKRQRRVVLGFMLFTLVIGMTVLGGMFFSLFVFIVFLIGFNEMNAMLRVKHIYPSKLIVITMGALMILATTFAKSDWLPFLVTTAALLSFFRLLFRQPRATISDIGATLMCVFYLIYFPVHYIMVRKMGADTVDARYLEPGLGYLILVFTVISASDVGAYYFGRWLGKSPLYPELSPKKTREGALGGVLFGTFMGGLVSFFIGLPLHHGFVLSVLLTIVGQLGDLTESLLKRDSGIKDSSNLLQGHGGVLDRADSYIFAGAVTYYYIHWVVLQKGLAGEILDWFSQNFMM